MFIFEYLGFKESRAMRGKEAAEFLVSYSDGQGSKSHVWMSKVDIKNNIRDFGECKALTQALSEYR